MQVPHLLEAVIQLPLEGLPAAPAHPRGLQKPHTAHLHHVLLAHKRVGQLPHLLLAPLAGLSGPVHVLQPARHHILYEQLPLGSLGLVDLLYGLVVRLPVHVLDRDLPQLLVPHLVVEDALACYEVVVRHDTLRRIDVPPPHAPLGAHYIRLPHTGLQFLHIDALVPVLVHPPYHGRHLGGIHVRPDAGHQRLKLAICQVALMPQVELWQQVVQIDQLRAQLGLYVQKRDVL
mmetsp:Transcript_33875/g.74595  ORF Transcript_33875/g.74595 Transcript_33875/m.74595 type:complete len:232 (+) Transcript_33875:710-1405(+)